MDTITIRDLEVWARIGVTEKEREAEQRLLISLKMKSDKWNAGTTDHIGDTVDYDAVAGALRELAGIERKTIERFAEDAAQAVLSGFIVESVTVTVKKFVVPGTKYVSVQVTRTP